MPVSVFTYGTLQVPSVMVAVTGKSFPSSSAVLPGYRRFQIKNRVYPAIVPDATASTEGVLYREVDSGSLRLLDEFEDILYNRLELVVHHESKPVSAHAYVLAEQYRDRLADKDWDLSEFEQQHLGDYLKGI